MSKARPISELFDEFSPEEKRELERGTQLLLAEYALIADLRKDQDLTQQELADIMDIRQSAISQIENREDVLVRTLERYVRALGGKLELRAKFPDRVVALNQFVTGDLEAA